MPRSRLFLLLLLSVSLLAGSWYLVVTARGATEGQGAQGPGGSSGDARGRLVTAAEELLRRHPDAELPELRRLVQELQDPGGDLAALEARLAEVGRELRRRDTGLREGEPGWSQALAFKTFSANGFRDLYESVRYPGVVPVRGFPALTGDPAADRRIVELAVGRGYRLRPEAESGRLVRAETGRLQPEALAAWRALQEGAAAEGVELAVVSAYRSVERQRQIFLAALESAGRRRIGRAYTNRELASGAADAAIDEVLRESSVPGSSRHHTGFTMDVTDAGAGLPFTEFGKTGGFRWLSAHNYLNAKRFGFIPSYPAGASSQGPEPEPWELVWVGTSLLLESPEPAPESPMADPEGPDAGPERP